MSWLDWLVGKPAPPTPLEDLEPAKRRQVEWQNALNADRVPGFVAERLRAASNGKAPWIATMTPGELLLTREHGIKPVAMVSGSCWFQYGYSWTQGHAEGWRRARTRMQHEAALAGANAVVDVQMRHVSLESEESMDFTLVGTAVTVKGLAPSKEPIIATVPALEFVRLLRADIVPVGVAIGANFEWLRRYPRQDGSWSWKNKPLTGLGTFMEGVRRKAIDALRHDALRQGTGVLAPLHFSQLSRGDRDTPRYFGRCIAIGTIVDCRAGASPRQGIKSVVDMRDASSPLLSVGRHTRTAYDCNEEFGGI